MTRWFKLHSKSPHTAPERAHHNHDLGALAGSDVVVAHQMASPVVYSPNYDTTEHTARELYERYRASAAEEVRTNFVKEWGSTFTIVFTGYPLPGSRQSIIMKLESEATAAYKLGRYEEALDSFCHWLALVDTDPATTVVSEVRASLTANVAACLGHLNLLDGAIEFYELSLKEFKHLPFSVLRDIGLSRLYYGSLVTNRIEYIEGQLSLLRAGKQPPADQWQDGYGVTRHWSPAEMEGKPIFYWSRPSTWAGAIFSKGAPLASQDGAWRKVGDGPSEEGAAAASVP